MSKKAEDFLKFAVGRGRGMGLSLGSSILGRAARPPPQPLEFDAEFETTLPGPSVSAPVQSPSNDPTSTQMALSGQPLDTGNRKVYVTRPETAVNSKEGTSGNILELSANYFKLKKKPEFQFSLYRVDFEPDVELLALRKALVGQQREALGGYLFDGKSMIYTTRRLPQESLNVKVTSREGQTYKMTIKHTGIDIQPTDGMAIQILNLILRRTMEGLQMQLVGRNLYDAKSKVPLKAYRVELWPGYITSIRQHEKDILVCCEVSHKVMRVETIYEVLKKIKNGLSSDWQEAFKKEILGSIVLTDYNNRTYRIDDVDFNSSPSSTFMKGDKEMSYVEYYSERYGRHVNDPTQPMLVSNPKARDIRDGRDQKLFLVPELCRSTGLTDNDRKNFQMMKAMADHTQMKPQNRKDRLLELTKRLHGSQQSVETLSRFNTDIEDELVTFKGRQLPQEVMIFGDNVEAKNPEMVDWTNAMKSNQMFKCVPLRRWIFIYPRKAANDCQNFLEMMKTVVTGMNYDMGKAIMVELPDDRVSTYVKAIEENGAKDPKFIVIVVPNNAADRYAAIKRCTCVTRTIPTQIIVQKTMVPKSTGTGPNLSIATKIIIQINCKLGGAPWMVKFPVKGVMTVGFDVNHDTKNRNTSYGAFVASMNLKECPEYFSAVSPHTSGAEMSTNIGTHMIKALKVYKEVHGCLPERIFFYRDGVGDGQIEYVHQIEVANLNKCLKQVYQDSRDKEPLLTFFIVNKRINTRIFRKVGSKVDNPYSGTVVDNTVTLPERYDFYLISQSVRQGTVSPTSYNVIYDTNGFPPDKLQMFTYKQTHLYYNWSGTVRVPAVVQYAHKLAFLCGEYLHQTPNENFKNQLYFL